MKDHWVLSMVALHYILRPIGLAALSVGAYAATVMLAKSAANGLGDHMRRIIFALILITITLACWAGYGLVQWTFNPAFWSAVFSSEAAGVLLMRGDL